MTDRVRNNIRVYAIAIAIALAVGLFSALLTRGNMQLYDSIRTPPLSPPSILFPIVWTVLYVLMGVSSAMVWNRRKENPQSAKAGLTYYAVSLFFNFAWSIVFFNFRWFLFAFVWLLILLYLIICTIRAYKEVSAVAAYLQIPYVLWVSFAGYLNFAIWLLNRSA